MGRKGLQSKMGPIFGRKKPASAGSPRRMAGKQADSAGETGWSGSRFFLGFRTLGNVHEKLES
jgi:hypothetical protein